MERESMDFSLSFLSVNKIKRIMVIGSPGAGKSTFTRKLQQKINLPIVYLDRLFWKADKTTVSPEEFTQKIEKALSKPKWIMDGNYSNYLFDKRLNRCDTVFFLDYDVQTCLDGVRSRRGMQRPDMPWIEEKEDPEFMDYIRAFPVKQKLKIIMALSQHPHVKIYHFKKRTEANQFLKMI